MATTKQILANQLNASKSTGPQTPEGKAISSKNALKHGLLTFALLPGEDPAAFEALVDDYYGHFDPVGPAETSLVDELIWCEWWRERFVRAETQLIARAMKKVQHARPVSKKDLLYDLVNKVVSAKAVEGGKQQTTNGEGVKPLAQQQAEEGETQIWPAFTAAYMERDLLGPIQRYATMYGHRSCRALLLLIRLQAARRVQKVAPPVAVDISLSNSESSKEVI